MVKTQKHARPKDRLEVSLKQHIIMSCLHLNRKITIAVSR